MHPPRPRTGARTAGLHHRFVSRGAASSGGGTARTGTTQPESQWARLALRAAEGGVPLRATAVGLTARANRCVLRCRGAWATVGAHGAAEAAWQGDSMRKALSWFSKAAGSGFAPALYVMAVLYKQGQARPEKARP